MKPCKTLDRHGSFHARNTSNAARRDAMLALLPRAPDWSLDWVRPPVLVADTRLAVMACPRTGRMLLQGWERDGPATAVLDLAG